LRSQAPRSDRSSLQMPLVQKDLQHHPLGITNKDESQRTVILAARISGLGLSCSAASHLLGALSAVVQEAYVHGISTRKVDELLVKALGMAGISRSQISRLLEELDEEVERFRGRPLEGPYPYVWVDATYVKARQDGRMVWVAVVIAVGVNGKSAEREVLGLDVGPSEDGAFWMSFVRSLFGRPRSS
jgi:mutator family transposase